MDLIFNHCLNTCQHQRRSSDVEFHGDSERAASVVTKVASVSDSADLLQSRVLWVLVFKLAFSQCLFVEENDRCVEFQIAYSYNYIPERSRTSGFQ